MAAIRETLAEGVMPGGERRNDVGGVASMMLAPQVGEVNLSGANRRAQAGSSYSDNMLCIKDLRQPTGGGVLASLQSIIGMPQAI
jgi:hypothetical protein